MTIGGQIHTMQSHICRKLPGIFQENGKGNQEAVNAASWFSEFCFEFWVSACRL